MNRGARQLARGTLQRGTPSNRASGSSLVQSPMHRWRRGSTTNPASAHRSSSAESGSAAVAAELRYMMCRGQAATDGAALEPRHTWVSPHRRPLHVLPLQLPRLPPQSRQSTTQQLSNQILTERTSFTLSSPLLWRPVRSGRDGHLSSVLRPAPPPRCRACASSTARVHDSFS